MFLFKDLEDIHPVDDQSLVGGFRNREQWTKHMDNYARAIIVELSMISPAETLLGLGRTSMRTRVHGAVNFEQMQRDLSIAEHAIYLLQDESFNAKNFRNPFDVREYSQRLDQLHTLYLRGITGKYALPRNPDSIFEIDLHWETGSSIYNAVCDLETKTKSAPRRLNFAMQMRTRSGKGHTISIANESTSYPFETGRLLSLASTPKGSNARPAKFIHKKRVDSDYCITNYALMTSEEFIKLHRGLMAHSTSTEYIQSEHFLPLLSDLRHGRTVNWQLGDFDLRVRADETVGRIVEFEALRRSDGEKFTFEQLTHSCALSHSV